MTKQEYIRRHRVLWFNIARVILKSKHPVDIRALKRNLAGGICFNCWLCEYVGKVKSGECEVCPLNTSKDYKWCLDGLFRDVCICSDYKNQYILAIKIATLPVVR